MNYEDMSDFEINKRAGMYLGHSVSAEYECIKTGSCFLLTNKTFELIEFNPCNNPSDAWSIIVENEIGVCKYTTDEDDEYFGMWFALCDEIEDIDEYPQDKNPLRAAMICFLKIKDAEK